VISVALASAIGLSSCVLTEGPGYVVQPYLVTAGAHVTIQVGPTGLLHWASDSVANGESIDGVLAVHSGTDVRCDGYSSTRYYGDRCAYRLLRDTPISGSVASSYWRLATDWNEFDDFREDSMAATRPRTSGASREGSCVHVTFTYVEPMSINWTWRPRSDAKC
jgi:hypothetical protein